MQPSEVNEYEAQRAANIKRREAAELRKLGIIGTLSAALARVPGGRVSKLRTIYLQRYSFICALSINKYK
jgi:hypothetical protein